MFKDKIKKKSIKKEKKKRLEPTRANLSNTQPEL